MFNPEDALEQLNKRDALLAELPAFLRERIHVRGEESYEQARVGRVFNARRPDRFPIAVLFAQSDADVIAGVRLARKIGVTVSIRSGGHSWAAWSVRENAVLIDLGGMREKSLDAESRIVTVNPGVSGGELNPYLKPFGFFFPGGHCPDVGLGGFLLQGGMGWNARGWGWACEQIVAIDVVTADGNLVHADAAQHSDLFWSARGAGPGFCGVVVRFYLRVRPLARALTRSTYIYPMEAYDQVMPWIHALHGKVATSVETVVIGMEVPIPHATHASEKSLVVHSLVVHALCFADTQDEAREALAPFETCPAIERALVRDAFLPTSVEEMYEEQRRENPPGDRYAADNLWTSAAAEIAVPAMKQTFFTLPTRRSFLVWFSMAPLRPLPDMALSLQSEIYFAIYTIWENKKDDGRCRQWLLDQMKSMEPISDGLYLGDSDFTTRSAKFVSDESWKRLGEVRAKYDPRGLFESYLASENVELNMNSSR
jgi:FAD/FMN-containing dehydrogenase